MRTCTDNPCTRPRRVTTGIVTLEKRPTRHAHRSLFEEARMRVRRRWRWLGENPQMAHVVALAALIVAVVK